MLTGRLVADLGVHVEIPLALDALPALHGRAARETVADGAQAGQAEQACVCAAQGGVGARVGVCAGGLGQGLRRELVVGPEHRGHV